MGIYIIEKLNSLNLERLEKLFFALFLLSIPLQTRLTFVTPQTYTNGYFNEYATFFIYLSDIFLIITFFLYFVNNLTKTKNFSIKFNRFYASPHLIPIAFLVGLILWSFLSINWAEYQNIAFFQSLKLTELILLALYINNRLLWFGLNKAFVLIFITGTFQALIGIGQYLTQKSLGLKALGESVLSPNLDNVAKIVVDGERIVRAYGTFPHPNIFGAFLILSIPLGFWLLFSFKTREKNQIVSSACAFIKKLFHVKQFDFGALNKLNFGNDNASADTREAILLAILTIGIILQLTVFILIFSRIAWLGIILIIVIFVAHSIKMAYLRVNKAIVSRETIYRGAKEGETIALQCLLPKLFHACPSKLTQLKRWLTLNEITKLFHVKQFYEWRRRVKQFYEWRRRVKQFWYNGLNKIQKYSIIIIIFSFILITSIFWNQITSRTIGIGNKYQQSIDYRVLYNGIAAKMINDRPLTGIGNGNFTLKMKDYSPVPLDWWQYQPAHNIYLLMASELGIIGLILFLIFIFSVIKTAYYKDKNQIVSRETILRVAKEEETIWFKYLILSVFIAFLFMGLFDHYFWTLQQGRLTFWLVMGMILAVNKRDI